MALTGPTDLRWSCSYLGGEGGGTAAWVPPNLQELVEGCVTGSYLPPSCPTYPPRVREPLSFPIRLDVPLSSNAPNLSEHPHSPFGGEDAPCPTQI